MAITRQKKEELIKDYVKDLNDSDNLVMIKQSGINVPDSTKIRKSVITIGGKFNVIRKRLFLIALKEAGYEEVKLEDLDGAIVALYAKGDQYGPLKVVNKFLKEYKRDAKKSSFSFLGGWFEKKWFNGEHIDDLANMPSKEELISKLAYIFNYPLQGFAGVLDQISKKQEAESGKPEVKEEVKEEVEVKAEEVKEEVKEETAQEVA